MISLKFLYLVEADDKLVPEPDDIFPAESTLRFGERDGVGITLFLFLLDLSLFLLLFASTQAVKPNILLLAGSKFFPFSFFFLKEKKKKKEVNFVKVKMERNMSLLISTVVNAIFTKILNFID